jgi:hypothetical protein
MTHLTGEQLQAGIDEIRRTIHAGDLVKRLR